MERKGSKRARIVRFLRGRRDRDRDVGGEAQVCVCFLLWFVLSGRAA